MKIYNSLTNKIEDFTEVEKNKIKMYICGPTVYSYIHIGNARPVIFFDVVKKYFEYKNYQVIYASNITDIDDKIVKKAIENHVTEKEIATEFENAFFEDSNNLHSDRPNLIPRATDYLEQMSSLIQRLIDKGYAYKVEDDIYFRVDKTEKYGILSNQTLDDLKDNVRIANNTKKENAKDFTLWKKPKEGILFNTDIGVGRPGWHTECVAMNEALFGTMIDIHGGGSDLKFPHHENEIAQSMVLNHHTIANFFMHVGRLNLDGEKMSKSLGNVIFVRDLLKKYTSNSFRLLILSTQYRQNISFSYDLMDQYEKEYSKILNAYNSSSLLLDVNNYKNDKVEKEYLVKMEEYFENDFNTGNVITIVYELVKKMNLLMRNDDLENLSIHLNTLKIILKLLGIEMNYVQLTDEDKRTYLDWEKARKEKKFEDADLLRKILIQKNIIK